jgi:hypothetical protein
MKANSKDRSWLEGLHLGLPDDFDYGVLRAPADASSLIFRLPNADRGDAAKAIVQQRDLLGREVAYQALIEAWDHDHGEVSKAFGTDEALAAAFRAVAPPRERKKPVRAWRGCADAGGWYGPSWTLDRDCACWFAFRFGSTPFVFGCDLQPQAILAEHKGRNERELIIDIGELDVVFLDEGDGYERNADDIDTHRDVSAGALADWRSARERWMAKRGNADGLA